MMNRSAIGTLVERQSRLVLFRDGLALVLGRVVLCDSHIEEIVNLKNDQMPDTLRFLIEQVKV
jgi:hypothetical protein